ncbi:hypothetical protein [Micromonospora sp. CNB394]|uniref:hypothetical protein n=1 Tax=Micromonospora sp. CNB394 TaxID=1169151 RepID=UPI0012DC76AB|nr:hypothetical protein [Micromonospora sp. CNB394]
MITTSIERLAHPLRSPRQPIRHHRRMPTRDAHGSAHVGRTQAAAMLGISVSHLDRLYSERATNGFPDRVNGTEWRADDIAAFQLPRDKARRAASDAVDRTGDPDELVPTATVARILGYRSVDSLQGRNRIWPLLLERVDDESLTPTGRKRRRWKRRTVWEIADSRTGKGASHTGRPRATPQGHPDRSGDPDELVGAAEAARVLGYNHPTALPDEVLRRADEDTAGPKGRHRRKWKRATLWAILDRAQQQR